MPACRGKKESDTAPSCDSNGRSEFEIIHPFHPDRGVRLQVVQRRIDGGVGWLWYVDRDGRSRRVKESFTDRAEPDAFACQAAGHCAFSLRDLVRLVDRVERLRRSRAQASR
jgi:hypothetical protein